MKKILALLAVLLVAFMIFACGPAKTTEPTKATTAGTTAPTTDPTTAPTQAPTTATTATTATTKPTTATTATTAPTTAPTTATTATTAKPEPVKPGDVYVDIDFDYDNEKIFDKKGNVVCTPVGNACVEKFEITHNGVTVEKEVLSIVDATKKSWVECTFTNLADYTEFNAFVTENGGFTIEAFYVNVDKTNKVGIVCVTEGNAGKGIQGWGLADAAGTPYFITGTGSAWAYTSQSAFKTNATDAYHIVCVYNVAAKTNSIYVNGAHKETVAADGFTAAEALGKDSTGEKVFNMGAGFFLGGDPTVSSTAACDFPATDLTIVDAKIYAGALDAAKVAEAYAAATAEFKGSSSGTTGTTAATTPAATTPAATTPAATTPAATTPVATTPAATTPAATTTAATTTTAPRVIPSAEEAFVAAGYDLANYVKLDLKNTLTRYWNSTSATTLQGKDGDATSLKFFATARFDKIQLPVGSIIVTAESYKFRPEGWQNTTDKNSDKQRPGEVTDKVITEVTEEWWGEFAVRAFNVGAVAGTTMEAKDYAAFAIYVPKDKVVPGKGLYVDVDFDATNGVTDNKGNATFQNVGTPVVEMVEVTHNGVTLTVPALKIKAAGNYVLGTFEDVLSMYQMNTILGNGFAIEVFYLDNSSGNAAVFCMTESASGPKQGYGIAHNASKNQPYFITGNSSAWHSVYPTAAASNSELIHVVAVYDPAAKTHSIYVNGRLDNTTKDVPGVVATDYTSKAGIEMFNKFGLGADLSPTNNYDFGATDMTIVDAKFYVGTLTADEIFAKYTTATAEFYDKALESYEKAATVFVPAGKTTAAINLATGEVTENVKVSGAIKEVKGGYLYLMLDGELVKELGAAVANRSVTGGATNINIFADKQPGGYMLKHNSYLIRATSVKSYSMNTNLSTTNFNNVLALLGDDYAETLGKFGTITITDVQSDEITFIFDGDENKEGLASNQLYDFDDEDYMAFKFVYFNYDGSKYAAATGTTWNPLAMNQMELIRYATDMAWGNENGYQTELWVETMRTYGGLASVTTDNNRHDGTTTQNANVNAWQQQLIPIQYNSAVSNYNKTITGDVTEAKVAADLEAANAALEAAQAALEAAVATNADVAAKKAALDVAAKAYDDAKQAEYEARVVMETEKAKDKSSPETIEATKVWKEVAKNIFASDKVDAGKREGTGPVADAYNTAKKAYDDAVAANADLKALNDALTAATTAQKDAQTAQTRVENYHKWVELYAKFAEEYEKAASVALWTPLEDEDDDFTDSALYNAYKDIEEDNRSYPTYNYYYDAATKTYTIFVTSGTQKNACENFNTQNSGNALLSGRNWLKIVSEE